MALLLLNHAACGPVQPFSSAVNTKLAWTSCHALVPFGEWDLYHSVSGTLVVVLVVVVVV